ncbi:hypothetical protein LXL04_013586 [Taraxacum kok-saghyz]
MVEIDNGLGGGTMVARLLDGRTPEDGGGTKSKSMVAAVGRNRNQKSESEEIEIDRNQKSMVAEIGIGIRSLHLCKLTFTIEASTAIPSSIYAYVVTVGKIRGERGTVRCGFKLKSKAVPQLFAKTLPMFKLPIFSLNSSISLFFIAQPSSRSTGERLIQSCAQIKASAVSGLRELLYLSITLPPVLNADSDATVEIGITKNMSS